MKIRLTNNKKLEDLNYANLWDKGDRDMSRFPKDCWDKNCEHFHVMDMSIDDLLCACDLLGYECDACDEDYCHLRCPLREEGK